MSAQTTAQALAAITDEGLFERLATAILREAEPIYRSLAHPGVNVAGKTVKAPFDAISFVQGADPPHMIVVHHTITSGGDLGKKWLHDPSKVKPRQGRREPAPPGDLIKTAELVAEERSRTPNLIVTIVLTTNQEPDATLVRTVEAAGRAYRVSIDLWSRSRLGHFLDSQPSGQWIRSSFLGIEQEQLSIELLQDLSKKSLQIYGLLDNPTAWIPRSLDNVLTTNLRQDVTFLVAGSGLGKSVACYRRLAAHVEGGGFGIVLPHEIVASALTLEQAVTTALRRLHPLLATVGPSAMSFCSPERSLLLVVEDINRSGQAPLLAEKLAGWGRGATKEDEGVLSPWRLLCPLWPELLSSLGEQARKRIEPLVISAAGFTDSEGREAVLARARVNGREMSSLSAGAISRALGCDPLLIALHDHGTEPDPNRIIQGFVDRSLVRTAAQTKDHPAADYRVALRALAGGMLSRRHIELTWREVREWAELQGEALHLLGRLAHEGELIRLTGLSDDQRLSFRHDRVRDWILADAAAELERRGLLTESIVAEPYFAEIIGAVVLVREQEGSSIVQRVKTANPLALFHALRLFAQASAPREGVIVQAIDDWLSESATHARCNVHLRWEALTTLAETDSPRVPAIVSKFSDRTMTGGLARLRNGDVSGGIELCSVIEPGSRAPWRDIHIEHAKQRYGHELTAGLDKILRRPELGRRARVGALRLAGHIADRNLGPAIEACWIADDDRTKHLDEYLWAFGECCGDDPARYLGPVCDAWAALSDEPDKKGWPSPRDTVAAHELRWAFHSWPPTSAIDYFIERGSQESLKWPITYMLHGMDDPRAVLFVVRELAAIQRRGSGSHFVLTAQDDWRRAQEDYGRPMSKASRELLLQLWRDEKNDKHLRTQALSLWGATQQSGDIEVLSTVKPSDELAESVLRQRLTRGDSSAAAALIERVAADEQGYWWQWGRYVWSPELTAALDEFLDKRGDRATHVWGESFGSDWATSEMIMRLPVDKAEKVLMKHWGHLGFGSNFVQAALYVCTPRLLEAAQGAINACPNPGSLMEHLSQHFGYRTKGHPGINRETQVRALAPYLHLLSAMDLGALWEACNDHGWFAARRELLDDRLQQPFLKYRWDRDLAESEFDKMIDDKHLAWIGHWIDRFVRTDVAWSEILATLAAWLGKRRSLEALVFVAAAVEHRGTRADLDVLRVFDGMPESSAREVIEDSRFAVQRRTIH